MGRLILCGLGSAQVPDRVILTETQRQTILAIGRGVLPVDPGLS
jgi:hypothetical protein